MILFAVCLLCLLSCSSALAATDVIASGDCGANGDNVTWELTADGVLTISGSGEMARYSYSGLKEDENRNIIGVNANTPWNKYALQIHSVIIGNGITSIGGFAGFINLTEVTIPNSVTKIERQSFIECYSLTKLILPDSVKSIGNLAFQRCRSLREVMLPDNITNIEYGTFSGCDSLREITIPNSVTHIGHGAFNGCSSLTEITIPASVTSIEDTIFDNCSNLINFYCETGNPIYYAEQGVLYEHKGNEIILKMYPTGRFDETYIISNNVTSIGKHAFFGCGNLEEVIIPNSVSNIGESAFSNCRSLKKVTVPNSVTTIKWGTFASCSDLTELILPNSVTVIEGKAFQYCKSLMEIILPDQLTSIGNGAFEGCKKLREITIPSSVTNIEKKVFSGCSSLTNIFVDSDNNMFTVKDNALFEKKADEIILKTYLISGTDKTYTIPDGVTCIEDSAFYKCDNLTEIVIPNSVTNIENSAFAHCRNLTKVIIPNNVTNIGSAIFSSCSSLTEITIPDSITNIEDWAFHYCTKLKKIILPDTITNIGEEAFYGCSSLTKIIIPKSITLIDYVAFWECDNLTDVYYPGTENEWNAITINGGNDPLLNATIHYNYLPSDTINPQNSSVAFESANMAVEENIPVDIHFDFDNPSATTTAYVWFTESGRNIAASEVTAEDAAINQSKNNGVFIIENAAAGNSYAFSFPDAEKYTVKASLNNPMELLENGTVGTVSDAFAKVENVLSRPSNQEDVISVIHNIHPENWAMRVMADGKELSGSDTVKVKKNDKKGTDVTVQLLSEDGKTIKGHILMITNDSVNIATNKQTMTTNYKGEATFTITGTQVGTYKIFVTWGKGNTITIPVTVEKSSGGSSSGGQFRRRFF